MNANQRSKLARLIQATDADPHGGKVMLPLDMARAILAEVQTAGTSDAVDSAIQAMLAKRGTDETAAFLRAALRDIHDHDEAVRRLK